MQLFWKGKKKKSQMISVNTDLAKGSRKPQRKKQTPPPKKKNPKR